MFESNVDKMSHYHDTMKRGRFNYKPLFNISRLTAVEDFTINIVEYFRINRCRRFLEVFEYLSVRKQYMLHIECFAGNYFLSWTVIYLSCVCM